jgi:anion-transporting  ArsA/GET3 family ATPase
VRRNAEEVVELLGDPSRCQVLLVTLPRELAVDETIEAAYEVEDRAGVTLAEVVVNQYRAPDVALARTLDANEVTGLAPGVAAALEASRAFERARQLAAADEVERLFAALPLRLLSLPQLDATRIGPAELHVLADALTASVSTLGHRP